MVEDKIEDLVGEMEDGGGGGDCVFHLGVGHGRWWVINYLWGV